MLAIALAFLGCPKAPTLPEAVSAWNDQGTTLELRPMQGTAQRKELGPLDPSVPAQPPHKITLAPGIELECAVTQGYLRATVLWDSGAPGPIPGHAWCNVGDHELLVRMEVLDR